MLKPTSTASENQSELESLNCYERQGMIRCRNCDRRGFGQCRHLDSDRSCLWSGNRRETKSEEKDGGTDLIIS